MCVGDGLAMDEALSCNGLDFLFKTISSWVGHCVVVGGTLSCLVWGTVLVMGGAWSCKGLYFLFLNNLLMGGTLCCNGWGHCLVMCVGDGLTMDEAWSCNGLDFFGGLWCVVCGVWCMVGGGGGTALKSISQHAQ